MDREVEFDPAKSERNRRERGLPFGLVRDFDFETALIRLDLRRDYGEPRFMALGTIGNRLYHQVFTLRGDRICVISLRKANRREILRYARHQNT